MKVDVFFASHVFNNVLMSKAAFFFTLIDNNTTVQFFVQRPKGWPTIHCHAAAAAAAAAFTYTWKIMPLGIITVKSL
jgi:hypothetical protein